MKKKIDNYIFIPSERKVIFSDFDTIDLSSLLLIVNVTRSEVIYNFADAERSGVVNGNAIILTYDTTQMDSDDKLLIYYETPEYVISDIDTEDQNESYFGYVSKEGRWIIKKVTDSSVRCARGVSGYEEAWGNRKNLIYERCQEVC